MSEKVNARDLAFLYMQYLSPHPQKIMKEKEFLKDLLTFEARFQSLIDQYGSDPKTLLKHL